jgi:hypothetical protein
MASGKWPSPSRREDEVPRYRTYREPDDGKSSIHNDVCMHWSRGWRVGVVYKDAMRLYRYNGSWDSRSRRGRRPLGGGVGGGDAN